MNGIRSPWGARNTEPVDPRTRARPGATPVLFKGRAYTLMVSLPFRIEEADARGLAERALADFLIEALATEPSFLVALERQKLRYGSRLLGPCVELPLPDASLWGAASSTQEDLARAMLLDRLCLALSEVEHASPHGGRMLSTHFLSVLRNP